MKKIPLFLSALILSVSASGQTLIGPRMKIDVPRTLAYATNGAMETASFGRLTLSGASFSRTRAIDHKSGSLATNAYVDRATGYPVYNLNTFGADPSGRVNSDTAFAAALSAIGTKQGCIQLGAGTYKFVSKITVTLSQAERNNLCIRGIGPNKSILDWPNASGGIAVTTQGQSNNVQISGLSLWTGQAGGGTALDITNASAFGGGDGNVSNIDDVYVAGDDKTSLHDHNFHYWNNGFITTAVSNINYDSVTVAGAGLTGLGRGITSQGVAATSTFGVSVNVSRSFLYALDVGFSYGTWCQGVQISQTTFVNGNYGIVVPADSAFSDQLSVVNSEFNTSKDQIELSNITHVTIIGNLFFTVFANTSAVSVKSAQAIVIEGNIFSGPGAGPLPNTNGIYVAANLSNNTAVISGNTFNDLTSGVLLSPSTTNWNVYGNSYLNNTFNVINTAGSRNSVGVATQ